MSKQAMPPPPGDRPSPSAPPPVPGWQRWIWPIAIVLPLLLAIWIPAAAAGNQAEQLSYSQFLAEVNDHKVTSITIDSDGRARGALADGHQFTTVIPPQAGPEPIQRLTAAQVQITAAPPGPSTGSQLLSWLLIIAPFLLILWFWRGMSRGASGRLQGAFGAGKAKAKVFDTERPTTTFNDVAGYEGAKAEIAEVVDFLRQPERYHRAGATAPRGVLMIGPPGTGKTLLARAVAGQADVPFFSVVGSSFVEMYVGVGAARVRDLFTEARKRAPAIIFVDEVDAIGARRAGSGAIVSNDEREQTLNQLLSEMDGFDPGEGIVVLAATNRPDVLDPALLRPGRFDRQVTIPLPTQTERAAILAVHCRDKHLDTTTDAAVDLTTVARATPGFSGADLANLANEAAINAVRNNRDTLTAADFDTARDRILLGRREGTNVLLPAEKHAVAVHEAGHALTAALCPHADPVAKVTILPAGQALGATEQLPLVERHLFGEDYLLDSLTVRLGGRAAELVMLGQGSTGAANDLAQATDLATKMVREFGLSTTIGPVGYPRGGSVFLGSGGADLSSRPFAEATQATIDAEVARLLRAAEHRATDLLTTHRDMLDRITRLLLEHETVDGAVVYQLAGTTEPSDAASAATVAPHRTRGAARATRAAVSTGAPTSTAPTSRNGDGAPAPSRPDHAPERKDHDGHRR